ncbi:LacI family DNA-binding transcriptional regulator [Microbacterium oleivorans]|uniref:LacI family DNA-binding transcriptional regulator n=1 Tax=Microbacterium oleivorans TaxID=273677 RepID=A0A7D5IUZ8_9MICO|nr:LacI family DNA-binding transcriptional regulator [Microbacterium oleivorans]QLD10782.1 LacI family DNA-binding transcriptional regulator [Microbacterium oleivorans]
MAKLEKPPTLTDVARLAGVSVPTASRALNGGVRGTQSGSPELRRRVQDAARALGYSVNSAAQAIKDGRARTVALLVSDIDDFGSATMISGIMHAAEKRGVSVSVRATRDDPLRELDLLTQLRGERHRAVIIGTSRTADTRRETALGAQLNTLAEDGTRVVVIGDSRLPFPAVTVDNREAARLLARGLAETGRRRFAIISAPVSEITARDRVEGFLLGLAELGVAVDPDRIIHRPFSRDGGYEAVRRLEDHLGDIEVIAAMSDTMAVGAIARLRDVGIEAPRDIEVAGFDHVPMLGDLLPRFSTVEVPLEAFGEAAMSLAFDDDAGPEAVIALRATPIVHGVPIRRRD